MHRNTTGIRRFRQESKGESGFADFALNKQTKSAQQADLENPHQFKDTNPELRIRRFRVN
jgi:hypothetical protein